MKIPDREARSELRRPRGTKIGPRRFVTGLEIEPFFGLWHDPYPLCARRAQFLCRRRSQRARAVRQCLSGDGSPLEPDRCRTRGDNQRPLGIAFQTPIGAAIDLVRAKRGVIVLSISAMAFASLIIFGLRPSGRLRSRLRVLAIAGDAFAPAVAALTLGCHAEDPAWPGGSAATRLSTMPATLRLRSLRARSDMRFRSARSSSWSRSSPP